MLGLRWTKASRIHLPARAQWSKPHHRALILLSRIEANALFNSSLLHRFKLKTLDTREDGCESYNSAVARIKTTFSAGPSKVFKRALKAILSHVHFCRYYRPCKSHDLGHRLIYHESHESHQHRCLKYQFQSHLRDFRFL